MRHTRRRALTLMSGAWMPPRPPRGGWHRSDPGDGGGDGSAGGGPAAGGENDDAGEDGDGEKKPQFTGDFDPAKAEAALGSARAGEKKAKQEAKEARDRLAAVLKAAGLTSDGKADPEEQIKALTEQKLAAEQRANALAVREAVRDAAAKHAANAGELLDSRKFTDQLGELDPTASDYADKVGALVAKAVKEHPAKYGTTPAKGGSGRSGSSDHTGGGSARTRPGLGAAIAARMTN
jgi:hypothetical protein